MLLLRIIGRLIGLVFGTLAATVSVSVFAFILLGIFASTQGEVVDEFSNGSVEQGFFLTAGAALVHWMFGWVTVPFALIAVTGSTALARHQNTNVNSALLSRYLALCGVIAVCIGGIMTYFFARLDSHWLSRPTWNRFGRFGYWRTSRMAHCTGLLFYRESTRRTDFLSVRNSPLTNR